MGGRFKLIELDLDLFVLDLKRIKLNYSIFNYVAWSKYEESSTLTYDAIIFIL